MSHPNAALTPRHHLNVAGLVVEDEWPSSEVAARFQDIRSTYRALPDHDPSDRP
jgi:hypothetical protein